MWVFICELHQLLWLADVESSIMLREAPEVVFPQWHLTSFTKQLLSGSKMNSIGKIRIYSILNQLFSFVTICFQVYYYQSGKEVIPSPYAGRLQPPSSPATTRNASIMIHDMQPSDSGVYTCEVHNFPDVNGQSQANIVVNVLGKSLFRDPV